MFLEAVRRDAGGLSPSLVPLLEMSAVICVRAKKRHRTPVGIHALAGKLIHIVQSIEDPFTMSTTSRGFTQVAIQGALRMLMNGVDLSHPV